MQPESKSTPAPAGTPGSPGTPGTPAVPAVPAAASLARLAAPLLAVRAALGGFLMGLANLVPGISGGTMLVAAGIYPQFVQAIANATRLRFTRHSLLVLIIVAFAAVVGIVGLAGLLGQLVVEQTWIMYSLFIGLTLGGVPVVWAMSPKRDGPFWIGAAAGFAAMAALAFVQMMRVGEDGPDSSGFILMFIAGTVGAGAMILPGLSGGYLLLVLGVYVTILNAIDQTRQAVQAADWAALREPVLSVVLPVALGVFIGIVVIANALKFVLDRFPRITLGVLLGLLLGAVVGLWPFQHGVPPEAGEMLKGQPVVLVDDQLFFENTGRPVEPKDYPRQFFEPDAAQVIGSLTLTVVGLAITGLVARLGRKR
ncbi:DUF368 domain-containing protein [Phycisphaerales bacterium AB-hyl4]|uniref:DUF368 domain-containing protein n=1 Tax=Natronomicrosphaera hydrolytica TaxID=3242702 RepID=A0ABV4U1Y3_9BACT